MRLHSIALYYAAVIMHHRDRRDPAKSLLAFPRSVLLWFGAHLVTLSACETGLGDLGSGGPTRAAA